MCKKPPKGYLTAHDIAIQIGEERQKVYDIVKYFNVDKFHNGLHSRAKPRLYYPVSKIEAINNMLKNMTYKEVKAKLNE